MGQFTVHADFNKIDGGTTITKSVSISMNTQVTGPSGRIYDNSSVDLVDGVLQVSLPANDNDPGDFGYTIRRPTGLTKVWRVPAQAPGATVELTDFTATTPLPLPASGNAVSQTAFEAYQTSNDAAVAGNTTALGQKVNTSTYTAGQATQDAALTAETTRATAAETALQNGTNSTFEARLSAAYAAKAIEKRVTPRASTLASLGDSIACNGFTSMAITSLVGSVAIGATTITVTSPEATASMISDFASGFLIKVGNEYSVTSAAASANGSNWNVTLAAGLTQAHTAGEQVISIGTISTGSPSAAFGATILSKGTLQFAGSYGHGSYTVEQIDRLYVPLVLAAKPGYCYVMAGRNVYGTDTADQNAARVVAIWDKLLAGGVIPIGSTIPPVNSQTSAARQYDQRFNRILTQAARKRGIPFIDFYAAMVNPATGDYASGLNLDATHPSDAGRVIQAQGIWNVLTGLVATQAAPRPAVNTYAETAVYPLPANQNNAMMLNTGGLSSGGGSTSAIPGEWQTGAVDATGVISIVSAPDGSAAKAIKAVRASGATSGTNLLSFNSRNVGTAIPGHRYRFLIDVKTNGLTTASANGAAFRVTLTHQTFSSTQAWINLSNQFRDIDGTILVDFVATNAHPTNMLVFVTLGGTAATPAYDATVWNAQVIDLTALGIDADSPWPHQATA